MLKIITRPKPEGGRLYIFGLTSTNLHRIQYNSEPIFFDFGYADRPDLFALIMFFPEVYNIIDADAKKFLAMITPFLNPTLGVTRESLRVFALTESTIAKMQSIPFWAFTYNAPISHPNDSQMFFTAATEADMEAYFREHGFVGTQTKIVDNRP